MGNLFNQDEVFPIIARTIRTQSQQSESFVTHEEIVAALLSDRAWKALVEQAHLRHGHQHSEKWLVSNMIAWFSQRITAGYSDWATLFERKRMKRKWAYKPAPEKQDSDPIVGRHEISQALWPEEPEENRDAALEKLVSRVRLKVESNPEQPKYLLTLRGRGYRLVTKPGMK